MNNNIAIIGSGKTGRGFVARLLNEAGLEFTFFPTRMFMKNAYYQKWISYILNFAL